MAAQHTRYTRFVAFLLLVCLAAALVRRVALPQAYPSSTPREPESIHVLDQPNLAVAPTLASLENPIDRIHGRWEAVRASLGLPPLPDLPPRRRVVGSDIGSTQVSALLRASDDKRASRFDLGRKRLGAGLDVLASASAKTRQYPPRAGPRLYDLHFVYDAQPDEMTESKKHGTSSDG